MAVHGGVVTCFTVPRAVDVLGAEKLQRLQVTAACCQRTRVEFYGRLVLYRVRECLQLAKVRGETTASRASVGRSVGGVTRIVEARKRGAAGVNKSAHEIEKKKMCFDVESPG